MYSSLIRSPSKGNSCNLSSPELKPQNQPKNSRSLLASTGSTFLYFNASAPHICTERMIIFSPRLTKNFTSRLPAWAKGSLFTSTTVSKKPLASKNWRIRLCASRIEASSYIIPLRTPSTGSKTSLSFCPTPSREIRAIAGLSFTCTTTCPASSSIQISSK